MPGWSTTSPGGGRATFTAESGSSAAGVPDQSLSRDPRVRVGRQLLDRDRQLTTRGIGERDVLNDASHVLAYGDPNSR
jgi:hypothetical protein